MSLPVISIAQMREWEQATWDAGRSPAGVIQQAGGAVAAWIQKHVPISAPLVVLAGKGHNGDDARAAAQRLLDRPVECFDAANPQAAFAQLQDWLLRTANTPGWIVDGLFGIGLDRPLSPEWLNLIQAINDSRLPVLAVDVPSGLDADTGQVFGEAVRATATITFGAPKIGLLQTSAAPYVGRLEVAPEIGLVCCPFNSPLQWTAPGDFLYFPPRRPDAGHKGTFGHLGILAGSLGYHGAAVLAALGAQRAQPGLITLLVPKDVYLPVASQLHSTMVGSWEESPWNWPSFSTILCGPGLANPVLPPGLKNEVLNLWRKFPGCVVVDASALDWLPAGPTAAFPRVITPHPGEAARMLGVTVPEIQADRPAAARGLSAKYGGCSVVLKGRHTLVCGPEGPVYANPTGNPHLAQGGAGDLLAGWLAGLAAGTAPEELALALRYAVFTHGLAADRLAARSDHWNLADLEQELGQR